MRAIERVCVRMIETGTGMPEIDSENGMPEKRANGMREIESENAIERP